VVVCEVPCRPGVTENARKELKLKKNQEILRKAMTGKEVHLLDPDALPSGVCATDVEAATLKLINSDDRNAAVMRMVQPREQEPDHFAGVGWKLMAVSDIKKGDVVCFYDGILTLFGDTEREDQEAKQSLAHVLRLGGDGSPVERALSAFVWNAAPPPGCESAYLGGLINSPPVIGGKEGQGNVAYFEALGSGRFLGSSSAGLVAPLVCIVAMRDIAPEEELLASYGRHPCAPKSYNDQMASNRGVPIAAVPKPAPKPSPRAAAPAMANPDCCCRRIGSGIDPKLCTQCSPGKRKPPAQRSPLPTKKAKKGKLGFSVVARGLECRLGDKAGPPLPSPEALLSALLRTEHSPHVLLALHAAMLKGVVLPAMAAAMKAVDKADAKLAETETVLKITSDATKSDATAELPAMDALRAKAEASKPMQQASQRDAVAEVAALKALTPPPLPPCFAAEAAEALACAPLAPLLGQLAAFPAQAWLVAYRREALSAVWRRGCLAMADNAHNAAAEAARRRKESLASLTASVEALEALNAEAYADHILAVRENLEKLKVEMVADAKAHAASVAAMSAQAEAFEKQCFYAEE